jgi:hypothetical protein
MMLLIWRRRARIGPGFTFPTQFVKIRGRTKDGGVRVWDPQAESMFLIDRELFTFLTKGCKNGHSNRHDHDSRIAKYWKRISELVYINTIDFGVSKT